MALVVSPVSLTGYVALNNGHTESGKVKTVNVSLGAMAKSAWDPEKAYNIATALAPCLERDVYAVRSNVVNELEYE